MDDLNNLVGLSGYAQSGKDTVAGILQRKYGYRRVAFADPLKELALKLDPHPPEGHAPLSYLVKRYGWEHAKTYPWIRKFLQDLGVGARDVLGSDIWVRRAFLDIDQEMILDWDTSIVITDVRFNNEIAAIKERGGRIVQVCRDGVGPVNGHISEAEWTNALFHATIHNNGSLDELEESVIWLHDEEGFW